MPKIHAAVVPATFQGCAFLAISGSSWALGTPM